jgi:DNA polymerase-3 subunit gamma/tau
MSYLVFALKWRPRNFDEIVGQERIVTTLRNAILKNRLAHAYIFAGPRGIGKTSTARILARALNCKDGPTDKPCGRCPSCLEIAAGTSLDVIEIDGASNRGIDEIMTLRENVKFSPVSGKYKIYIIDEVHQITPDGFNALLKTLEEPPAFVKFIFATTQPQKVPSTILSRCHRLDFRRISVREIAQQLEKIVSAEKIKVDQEVLLSVARAGDGSLRDAESILDQLMAFAQDKVSAEDVVSMLGMVEQKTLFDIADKIIQKDPDAALQILDDIIDKGKDAGIFLTELIAHFRNLMIAKVSGGSPRLLDLPEESCARLLQQAGRLSLEEIFTAFSILANTHEMAKRLDSLRIPLEISLVKLSRPDNPQTIVTKPIPVKQKTAAVQAQTAPIKEKSEESKPDEEVKPDKEDQLTESSAAKTTVTLEQVKEVWQEIIQNISKIKMSVGTYLNEGLPYKMQGEVLTVSFSKSHSLHKEALEKKENKELIEKNLSAALHQVLRINFRLSEEEVQKTPENHPSLRSALDMFNGRLIR